jgi:hypothetical protein
MLYKNQVQLRITMQYTPLLGASRSLRRAEGINQKLLNSLR